LSIGKSVAEEGQQSDATCRHKSQLIKQEKYTVHYEAKTEEEEEHINTDTKHCFAAAAAAVVVVVVVVGIDADDDE
jgi:hypothetical protein